MSGAPGPLATDPAAEDVRAATVLRAQLHAAGVLAGFEARRMLLSWPLYLTTCAACLAGSLLLRTDVAAVVSGGVMVLAAPLQTGLLVVSSLLSLYGGLLAALSPPRERERGTLEGLFYGPVDGWGYVAGRLARLVLGYWVSLVLTMPYWMLVAALSGLGLPLHFVWLAVLEGLAYAVALLAIAAAVLRWRGVRP